MNNLRTTLIVIFIFNCTLAFGQDDKAIILENINNFSKAFVAGDYESMVNAYTDDAMLMAPMRDPIKGKAAIREYWTTTTYKQLKHKLEPVEIIIDGDLAYDYGFIFGQSETNGVAGQPGSSKYYVVWKKVNGQWKIHFDMWNARDAGWRDKK